MTFIEGGPSVGYLVLLGLFLGSIAPFSLFVTFVLGMGRLVRSLGPSCPFSSRSLGIS